MDRPYIEELWLQNYGCHRDLTIQLTPLHALIGPNDSGKSTVLRALRTLSLAVPPIESPAPPDADSLTRMLRPGRDARDVRVEVRVGGMSWALITQSGRLQETVPDQRSRTPNPSTRGVRNWPGGATGLNGSEQPGLVGALRGSQVLRLDPDALRQPGHLIQDGHPLRFQDDRGTGLPGLIDALIARDVAAYVALIADVRKLFPTIESLSLRNVSTTQKAIGVRLTAAAGGKDLGADEVSEGFLYWLAFAVLRHLAPTALLLVEEPENGLHPSRIAEVMRILREISTRSQVVIATHSPLVINELKAKEVTLLSRDASGATSATRLDQTRDFERRNKAYALGELWLSYADGDTDAKLLPERGPAA